ncbi:hypothetical protein PULV_b0792 [Pseudoalteromonas ulvae UL12]|uniref:Orphan protein n=1 Tax=Pseudoalteromonas ulvae TaxID=107327 RepID=A0A244CRM3_PSEDV|nr:hypothetical protein [Pseudoalteromonas ulvae]MBE0366059.1 hypothetical protein [Pseudoalteromonas ulvae UL12]OUL58218.1 hypothetical protein B1199_07640 [Pseudoalteromonas ulvae]
MNKQSTELNSTCLAAIKAQDEKLDVFAQINEANISAENLINLLAHYQSMSENDDDDMVDAWLDNLSDLDKKILQAFEISRGRFEHSH